MGRGPSVVPKPPCRIGDLVDKVVIRWYWGAIVALCITEDKEACVSVMWLDRHKNCTVPLDKRSIFSSLRSLVLPPHLKVIELLLSYLFSWCLSFVQVCLFRQRIYPAHKKFLLLRLIELRFYWQTSSPWYSRSTSKETPGTYYPSRIRRRQFPVGRGADL